MTTETARKKESKSREVTFKCKFCEDSKPLTEMVVLTRYFPMLVACRACEKKMR